MGVFQEKETIRFLLMVEDKISQVSVPIRIVKRKVQEVQVKPRGLELYLALQQFFVHRAPSAYHCLPTIMKAP